jgi:hypothetical protein
MFLDRTHQELLFSVLITLNYSIGNDVHLEKN